MYFIKLLVWLRVKQRRKELLDVATTVAIIKHRPKPLVIIDMLFCTIKYGAMFTEYENLSFYEKKHKQRRLYFTTFQEYKLLKAIDKESSRMIFHDKVLFLQKFRKYIKREWWKIDDPIEALESMMKKNSKLVLKGRLGDSGKEVAIYKELENTSVETLISTMSLNKYDLVEEFIVNHPILSELNSSSLNTLRIVTLYLNGKVEVLFAGIRVGKTGADLDNVSQGGAVAKIDIKTGKICTPYYFKKTAVIENENVERKDNIGLQLPYWKEVIVLVKEAAAIVPEIGIVAWDVCIREDGPELIEGNESFGCVVMQVFGDDHALKPRITQLLKENNIHIKL